MGRPSGRSFFRDYNNAMSGEARSLLMLLGTISLGYGAGALRDHPVRNFAPRDFALVDIDLFL